MHPRPFQGWQNTHTGWWEGRHFRKKLVMFLHPSFWLFSDSNMLSQSAELPPPAPLAPCPRGLPWCPTWAQVEGTMAKYQSCPPPPLNHPCSIKTFFFKHLLPFNPFYFILFFRGLDSYVKHVSQLTFYKGELKKKKAKISLTFLTLGEGQSN